MCPTARIQRAHAPATWPMTWATGAVRSATNPPSRPATVAGATAGPARRLANDRHERDLARDGNNRRRAGQLRSERHRNRERAPSGHPPQERAGHDRREKQDAAGGAHRQHESRRSRQPRVDEQQGDDRPRQRPHAPALAVAKRCDPDGPHGGGPDHAGIGSGQDHESDDRHCAEDPQSPTAHSGRTADQEHHSKHDGQVGARDRHQVGQTRAPKILLDLVAHAADVAVDERRYECPWL